MKGNAIEYDKNNGDILIKGQYLNGKRNGYGDEYKNINCEKNNNHVIYYKKINKINDSECVLIFSGEYLNGERICGKEYNYNKELL